MHQGLGSMTELIVKSSTKAKHKITRTILKEVLDREQKMLQAALARTKENLNRFEILYKTDSASFFAKYQRGETDDRNDYVDWAGEYQIFRNIQNQLDCLGDIVLCK